MNPLTTKAVLKALKAWDKPALAQSLLRDLYLVQQKCRVGENVQQAIQSVFEQALKTLPQTHDGLASLLQARFVAQKSVAEVAHERNVAESTLLTQQRQGIELLTSVIADQESTAREAAQAKLKPYLALPHNALIGVEAALQTLRDWVQSPQPPWLISIEGLGGIGKTALASALVDEVALTARFEAIAWVSAKQAAFAPVFGPEITEQPVLDQATLVNSLLEQLPGEANLAASPEEKWLTLTDSLKSAPYLIVIDNLETVLDYETLLPLLRPLVNPSRVLLTSRYSLGAYTDVACFAVQELDQDNTRTFIRQEAQQRRMMALAQASTTQLDAIHQVVGGNPLALKLVIGQVNFLPLAQVLTGLQAAQGKASEALYTYIYWQAWHLLEREQPDSLAVFLRMPLLQDGSFAQIAALNPEFIPVQLADLLQPLIQLSLVQVTDSLETRRYALHRLTETFLLKEALKWQASS